MNFWDYENIRAAVGGTWATRTDGPRAAIADGVSIDTRTIRPGQVYFAIRGERFDGHRFVGAAARAGSPLAIIDDPVAVGEDVPPGVALLRVADTRAALARLATAYRRTLEGTRVVAITGSNGKTTTTRLIHAILSSRFRGSAPQKSFNNDIGVPLTVLAARRGDQYLVCEIGTSGRGEIAMLAAIVQPDIAVITSIGRAHIGGLGSVAEIAREKWSLTGALRAGGLAVSPADAPALEEWIGAAEKGAFTTVTFGRAEHADVRITSIACDDAGVSFTLNGRWEYRVPLLGAHNASNAAAAVAVARRFAMEPAEIATALAGAGGAAMRLERRTVGGVSILNDAYNASPESMLAAIATLAGLSASGRRVAVLGDMLELGDESAAAHREVAEAIADADSIDGAVLIGPAMKHAASHLRGRWPAERVLWLADAEGPRAALAAEFLRPGDTALLKGSRLMGIERIAGALEGAERGRTGAAERAVAT
jgi:UDP-N-acetylmuramoyl-tripeptide--D-alanyl-D-alanine ligase